MLTPGNAGSECVVRATKATETNYFARASVDTTITVLKTTQATLVVSSLSATYGATLSLTTSGGSGSGVVSYEVVSGTCSIVGSTLTPGNAGSSCVVKATKATETNYFERSSADASVNIVKATQSVLTVSTTSATYRQDLELAVSGGSGAGAVSYTVVSGTCSVSGDTLTPGNASSSCVVKATKATDTNYNERSSSNTTVTVGKAQQTGLRVTSASSFTTGSSLLLTATGGQSTGSLSWSVNSGICSLNGSTVTAARGGVSCVVEVTRAGDSNYVVDSATQTVSVDKITQVLTFRSTVPSSPMVGGSYTVQVDSDAFLAPTIAIANSSSSVCSISAAVVSFNAVGTCLVSVSQAGNDVYSSAAVSQSVNVAAVPPSTTVAPAGGANSDATPVSSTTVPQKAIANVGSSSSTSSTSSTTSTTTTTTTTIPAGPGSANLGPNGEGPELAAGKTTAMMRGKRVKVSTETVDGQITMTLPGNVLVKFGTTNAASGGAQVGDDGVLRMYGNSQVDVGVSGLVPQTTYTVFMFSDPVELARGEATSTGGVNQTVVVPKDVETGEHTMQFNGVGPNNEVVSISMGFEVLDRQDNTRVAVIVLMFAIALALLGGRPIFQRRRRV